MEVVLDPTTVPDLSEAIDMAALEVSTDLGPVRLGLVNLAVASIEFWSLNPIRQLGIDVGDRSSPLTLAKGNRCARTGFWLHCSVFKERSRRVSVGLEGPGPPSVVARTRVASSAAMGLAVKA